MAVIAPATMTPRVRPRVVLAGGGHAHLAVLADWIREPLEGVECWLITASPHTAYSGMLPGWMAGHYCAHDLFIDLRALATKTGIKLVIGEVVALDADARCLTLSGGEVVSFDLLSLATGGETDTSSLAALGEKLLPVRPVADFMERWSRFVEQARHRTSASVAIVGGGAAGVELALAAAASLQRHVAQARICLVTSEEGLLAGHAANVREKALAELSMRGVSLHFAQAVSQETGLLLSNGDFLAADCVIAATGSRAPRWLAQSGLTCDERGFVAVGADLSSVSHPEILAAGDIIARVDRELERSGVHAVKAGPVLAANLRASLKNEPRQHYSPRKRTLYLLATGDRRAILSWGRLSISGRLAWRLKDWIDRYFVGHYSELGRGGG